MKITPHISIVSPVYRAENLIEDLVRRIHQSVSSITSDYEIILVEDCGPDSSWDKIVALADKDPKIKGFQLSRNFGQHYAITCGLDQSKAEWVVVMDCDLQDRPEEIVPLYQKAISGYDVVLAKRDQRQDTFLKKFFSIAFYRTLGYLTGSAMDEQVANFGIYHRNVINAVCELRESIRYFPTMIQWVGFKQTAISVTHSARDVGKSTYNFKSLLNLALDIILAYSDKPIRLMIKLGILVSLLSFIMGFYFSFQYFLGNVTVPGYTSLILSIWFFSGLLLILVGVVGLYVGKTFEGVKKRPIYLIQNETK
jgi:glycosyltransferase involved in cell wall biosynthesis